jgi:hypothetical protein
MNKPNTTYTFGMSSVFHKDGNKETFGSEFENPLPVLVNLVSLI